MSEKFPVTLLPEVEGRVVGALDSRAASAMNSFIIAHERHVARHVTKRQVEAMANDEARIAREAEHQAIISGERNSPESSFLDSSVDAYLLGDRAYEDARRKIEEEPMNFDVPSIETVGMVGEVAISHLVLPHSFFTESPAGIVFSMDRRHFATPRPEDFWTGRFPIYSWDVGIAQAQDGNFWIGPKASEFLEFPEL